MSACERFWETFGRFDPFAKPVGLLTLRDLQRHPIWEYALNTEGLPWRDETWVRPLKRSTIPWDEYSLTVAADLTTRSGRTFAGTAYVSTDKGVVDVPMGVMVVGKRWFSIPNAGQWRENEKRADLLDALGETYESVFPIRWTLKVAMVGEGTPRSGTFNGGA